jgi:uncharacterized protein YndB with AHSA1/START domain
MSDARGLGRIREERGRRSVRFERRYDASPEEVWAALTRREQLGRWLAAAPVFEPEVGGRVVLDFGEDGGQVEGLVRVFDPPRALEYTWTFTGEDESILRFELEPDADGTHLVLDHRLLGPDHAASYGAGWHAHLDTLAATLSGEEGIVWWDRFEAVRPDYQGQLPEPDRP